jgi:uncharacterized membrane protein YjfL (UPF0719 family)
MLIILEQYLITFGWAITGAVSMAVALGISLKIYDWLTPINEWKEIEKGNMAMALVLSSVILGTALVVALTVMA